MKNLLNLSSRFLLIVLSIAFAVSCSDSKKEEIVPTKLILQKNIVEDEDVALFLDIYSSGKWTLSFEYEKGVREWIDEEKTVTKGEGNYKDAILYFDQNSNKEERKVKIILSAPGSADYKVVLTQKGTGRDEPEANLLDWLELPQVEDAANCKFVTHLTSIENERVRNYSLYYDKKEKLAYWVAYPMVTSYLGAGRSNKWGYDPKFTFAEQVNLAGSIKGYDRGHQIPSGDRRLDNRNNSNDPNVQTFYYTNMTPQLGGLNQQGWASLETKVRSWVKTTDTLYVVTGAILQTKNGNEPVEYAYTSSSNEKMAIPNYYYKVLLQKYNGQGHINGYRAIGFWIKHEPLASNPPYANYAKSVREIEELTGFDFFPNLEKELSQNQADEIERSLKLSAWGL